MTQMLELSDKDFKSEYSKNNNKQSCLSLCYPMDYSPPGSSVHGFCRQEYWSGLPFPSPVDLPESGMVKMLQQAITITVETNEKIASAKIVSANM